MAMELQLEVSAASGSMTRPLPAGVYLDNDASPLTAAYVVQGKNLARNEHLWSVQGTSGAVSISELEVGGARQRLQDVEIELVLTKVTEWETRNFEVGMGWSDFLRCGPFELRAFGEAQRLKVNAWPYPQFREEQEAYRQRMPLNFLNQVYAMQELKVVDAANRRPTSIGGTIPQAGAASNTYTGWRASDADEAAAASVSEDIVYPVSVSVRLPKRFEKERVRFRFDEIPLPSSGSR